MNRLASATSPYLLQHADNPVHWWEWGPDAFTEARRRDVPILLSVGYAACHWCHVMAHESFEDPETAAVMNAGFVNVKVDREERPDVDAVYMEATTAMTGRGGWPMTVFCTPDGQPFFCGTYFPPEPRPGMPSFRQLLGSVSQAWVERRAEVEEISGQVQRELTERAEPKPAAGPPGEQELHLALYGLVREFDAERGGFGAAPKFPPSTALAFLLRHHARTGVPAALEMVEASCQAMARGGLYDQLGGGFARYSVDADWVVPHFEKMLYDNALLLRVYTQWWKASGAPLAERVAIETAEWLLRELRTPEGGFASSLDADSEGGEGTFYVWTPDQLTAALGVEDGGWAAELFGVTEAGTFEHGTSVLRLRQDPADSERYQRVLRSLSAVRERRVRPALDDKVVAAWNGLAIAALAEAGAVFDRPDLVEAALAAADLMVTVHLDSGADATFGRLARTSRGGRAGANQGVLEDYANLAEGFLTLYAVVGDETWLVLAGALLDTVLAHFADGDGGFHDTADFAEQLVRRPRDVTDSATPAGASAAAGALLTFAGLAGSARHRQAAEGALARITAGAASHPRFVGAGLAVAEALLDGPREVAVVGPAADPRTGELHAAALRSTAPGLVVAVGEPGSQVPLLRDRPLVGGAPAAYVCRQQVCQAPVVEPQDLTDLLEAD